MRPHWTLSPPRWRTSPAEATAWSAWSHTCPPWPNASRSGSKSAATPAGRLILSDPAEILVAMTADDGYRIYVEAWDPSYGTPVDMLEAGLADGSPAGESTAQLVLDVEAPP